MMKIAISYRRTDESETLKLLVAKLKDHFGEKNVYVDVESTDVGEGWMLRWSQAYVGADCIIAVIGPHWSPERLRQKDDPVLLEVSGGSWASLGWQRVVPVMIDGGVLPARGQLPLGMRPLLTRQGYVIDPQAPAESIARFLDRLEHGKEPPPGWRKHLQTHRTAPRTDTVDLTGEWELQSKPALFTDIHVQQDGLLLKLWALGAYADEIIGEGFVAIEGPAVSFFLMSKQHGPAGMLVLKHDAKSGMLTGRWMPPRPLWLAVLSRKKVAFKRKEHNSKNG